MYNVCFKFIEIGKISQRPAKVQPNQPEKQNVSEIVKLKHVWLQLGHIDLDVRFKKLYKS